MKQCIYTQYYPVCQAKMTASVHYIHIRQTYCLPNIPRIRYVDSRNKFAYIAICIVVCKDTVTILPGGLENHHYYHTVEGREVTFSYKCSGANVINHWGVDGHSISQDLSNTLNFSLSSSSVHCVNTLNLTLYNVNLEYPTVYTAYPSSSERFSTTGLNITAHLSEIDA